MGCNCHKTKKQKLRAIEQSKSQSSKPFKVYPIVYVFCLKCKVLTAVRFDAAVEKMRTKCNECQTQKYRMFKNPPTRFELQGISREEN